MLLLGLVDHFQGGGFRLDARLLLVELAWAAATGSTGFVGVAGGFFRIPKASGLGALGLRV